MAGPTWVCRSIRLLRFLNCFVGIGTSVTYDVDNLLNGESEVDGQSFTFVENWSFEFVVGAIDEQITQQAALHRSLLALCSDKQTSNITVKCQRLTAAVYCINVCLAYTNSRHNNCCSALRAALMLQKAAL